MHETVPEGANSVLHSPMQLFTRHVTQSLETAYDGKQGCVTSRPLQLTSRDTDIPEMTGGRAF